MDDSYLIVGLGNPGRDYARTRHNAGFLLLDRLAQRWGVTLAAEKKFNARVGRAERDGRRVVLCEPQTYMNLSGEAVGAVMNFHKLPSERLLVVVDDADLPLGALRLRPEGSSGGHHGLESVEQHLGTRQYARLRLGIGRRANDARQIAGWVLAPFGADEEALLEKVLQTGCEQVECWLFAGTREAMNRFNGTIEATNDRKARE
ncbi:MAG: peptidyl-tRNA hydrolase [Verrucomicrobiota bacterium]|jgi:PTH1 family peptidyl-tRNA hydrolase